MKLGSVSPLLAPPPDVEPVTWRINRAAELGLSVIGVFFRDGNWKEPGYLENLAELAARKGVELRLSGGGNMSLRGAEADAEIERGANYLNSVAARTGIKYSSLPCGPMTLTRWSPEPPLDERLDYIPQNLARLADAVVGQGLTLAVENHCDYRGYEIAQILQKANRPNLKVQLDTGNAFSVFEEPVDCARVLAPYTVSVHLKDIQVVPFASAPVRGSRAISVPLGQGNVDNVEICRILQKQASNPAAMPLMVEPFYLPEDTDAATFLQTSLAWAREHLAEFI